MNQVVTVSSGTVASEKGLPGQPLIHGPREARAHARAHAPRTGGTASNTPAGRPAGEPPLPYAVALFLLLHAAAAAAAGAAHRRRTSRRRAPCHSNRRSGQRKATSTHSTHVYGANWNAS
jgi:hypothetical protein